MSNLLIIRVTLLVTFFTGFAGLAYEVLWQRYLRILLGSEARSSVLVLAVFLAALASGYLAMSRFSKNKNARQLMRIAGWAEVAVGLWAICFFGLFLFSLNFLISSAWLMQHGLAFDVLLTVVLIGPAGFLMGANLPLLTGALEPLGSAAWSHARLYATNTLGAVLGCVVTGFFLVPMYGLHLALGLSALVNIVCGSILLRLARELADSTPVHIAPARETTTSPAALSRADIGRLLAVAACTGFCGLTLQTIFFRILGLSAGSTELVFTLVVGAAVALIGFGTLLASRLQLSPATLLCSAIISLVFLYCLLPYAPYGTHVLRTFFPATLTGFACYHLSLFVALLVILGIPLGSLGALLPILFRDFYKRAASATSWTGLLYAANTVGCVVGAIVGGHLLLGPLDLDQIFIVVILSASIAALLLSSAGSEPRSMTRSTKFLRISAIIGLLSMGLPGWNTLYMSVGTFQERQALPSSYAGAAAFYKSIIGDLRILKRRDGPLASVAVAEFGSATAPPSEPDQTDPGLSRSILINGKPDGNTLGDRVTMHLLGYLPYLLAPAEQPQGLMIGLGTGLTAAALTHTKDLQQLDIVELSAEVQAFAPYFDFATDNLSSNTRATWHTADGYRFLLQNKKTYDIIVTQPTNPWMAGSDLLYSKEFYQAVKQDLNSDGLFVQWLSLWGLAPESVATIIHTLKDSFADIRFFQIGESVILVASNTALRADNLDQTLRRFNETKVRKNLETIGITTPDLLFALETWIPAEVFPPTRIHSLYTPVLSRQVIFDFYRDSRSTLESLLEHTSDWRWSLLHAKNSWLASYHNQHRDSVDVNQIKNVSCGHGNIELVEPDWRYIRSVCRDSLIASMALRQHPLPDRLEQEFLWLKNFQQKSPSMQPQTVADTVANIQLFTQFYSIFLDLSAEHLVYQTSPCFRENTAASLQCRTQLVHALIYTGHLTSAQEQLGLLLRDADSTLSTTTLKETQQYLAQALHGSS